MDPYHGSIATFFADVTGPYSPYPVAGHAADAIGVNYEGIAVRDSHGTSFHQPDPKDGYRIRHGDQPIRAWGYWTLDAFYGTRGTFFADVDGSGADAIAVKDDGVWIRRSRFSNFWGDCTPH